MKVLLRYLFFSLISFYFTQLLFFPFKLIENLSILYLLAFIVTPTILTRSFLKFIRLPHSGFGFAILNVLIHSISLYLGSIFLKKYSFMDADLPNFTIFDTITTPRVDFNEYTSIVFFVTVYTLMFGVLYFISWPHEGKKKK